MPIFSNSDSFFENERELDVELSNHLPARIYTCLNRSRHTHPSRRRAYPTIMLRASIG